MVGLLIVLIISFGYGEIIWWALINNKRPNDYLQKMMRFFIGFNVIIAIALQSFGNMIFVIILALYYFVLIPYRISKIN